MATEGFIPTLDFKEVVSAEDISAYHQIQEQLHEAFSGIGCAYITNHGIDPILVEKVFSVSKDFFSKPVSIKKKCLFYHYKTNNTGYIPYGVERGIGAPANAYETFEACDLGSNNYPEEDVPEFRDAMTALYKETTKLIFKLFELLAHALKLSDPLYFVKTFGHIGEGSSKNYTTLRSLYYPAFPRDFDFKSLPKTEDNWILRLKEHLDIATLVILFPNPQKVGGLQVKDTSGTWIDATLNDNTVIVTLGQMIQTWTADKYRATPHRVVIPDSARFLTRQSLVFFSHPDGDTPIECVDGSNKYQTLTAWEHTAEKIERLIKPENYFTVEAPSIDS